MFRTKYLQEISLGNETGNGTNIPSEHENT